MSQPITTIDSDIIVMLHLTLLYPSPDNTRKTYDEESLQELAQTIATSGIITPLVVRIPEDGTLPERYEILAGHRRYLSAQRAGLLEVPCLRRRMTDEQAHEFRILENLQREGLHPLDEAESYQQMFANAEATGHSIGAAEIANKIGKSEGYVRLRLRILSALPEVRDALRQNQITLGHALEIARLDSSLQLSLLRFCLFESYGRQEQREEPASIAELRRYVSENIMLVLTNAPFDVNDSTLLSDEVACTDCSNRTGNSQKLFADIEQSDICTLPTCFTAKVNRHIDVTVEELTAKGKTVVRLSDEYGRSRETDKNALIRHEYTAVKKTPTCADLKTGLYVDGAKRGTTVTVCVNGKCSVHHPHVQRSSVNDKEKRAAARKEAAARSRIFAAIYDASSTTTLNDAHTFTLAEFALKRAEHNGLMKLAKLLDWPKDLFGWSAKDALRKKLEEVGVKAAVIVATMATVASELSVNEYSISSKSERLEALAKLYSVNTTTVRKTLDAELKAKQKQPAATPKTKAATSPAKSAKTTKKLKKKVASKKAA